MAKRSVASATLSFGLVAIPVKFYVSASADNVSFNLITPAGNRVKMMTVDAVTGDTVTRNECKKGYEYAKGKPLVIFSDEELKALGEGESGSLEIVEFVPEGSFDVVQVEKTYFLDADKGGDKAYRLLVAALKQRKVLAIAQWINRGREHLVMIGVREEGLVAHMLFYASEVRKFELDCATFTIQDRELAMAGQLIDSLSSEKFDHSKYTNKFNDRVEDAVQKKLGGQQVNEEASEPAKDVGDLFAMLQASLSSQKEQVTNSNETKKPKGKGKKAG